MNEQLEASLIELVKTMSESIKTLAEIVTDLTVRISTLENNDR